MQSRWIQPITLTQAPIKLEPLSLSHEAGLIEAATDGELWNLWVTSVPTPQNTREYIKIALDQKEKQGWLPFVVSDVETGNVLGTTRYCNVEADDNRLEIGYTWYAKSVQRSAVNTTCKLLLLQHAFEKMDAIAVEFRTHWHNQDSRNAILRLGAKQDGVLRNHKKYEGGVLRDTVVFSILNTEWPAVKKGLQFKLEKYRQD